MSRRDVKPEKMSPAQRRVMRRAQREERRLARMLRRALAHIAREIWDAFDGRGWGPGR